MAHALSVDDPLPHTEVAEEPPATAPGGGQWATALVAEAVAVRPVEEVVQLLALLDPQPESEPDPAVCTMVASRPPDDLALVLRTLRETRPVAAERILRAAATAKPLPDLAELLKLMGVDRAEADAALRTVATHRPVGDVVQLAELLRGVEPRVRSSGSARAARIAADAPSPPGRGDALGWAAFALLVIALAVQVPLFVGHWAGSTALSLSAGVGAGLLLLLYGWLAPRAALSPVVVGVLALAVLVVDGLLLLGVLPHPAQLTRHGTLLAYVGMAAAMAALLLGSVRLLPPRRV